MNPPPRESIDPSSQPGSGKSSVLRILHQQLQNAAEIRIAILSRPQASVADFYRELRDHFGVALTASNRWGGAKLLESVRKGIRLPDLTSPFPSGEPRAEAQRHGGVFELAWGGGSMLKSLPLGEIN